MATRESKQAHISRNGVEQKKRKLSDTVNSENSVYDEIKDLSNFRFETILHNNTNRKIVCLQGTFSGHSGTALVILEKTAFDTTKFEEDCEYFCEKSFLEKIFQNDIYGNFHYYPKIDLNAVKATIIFPATAKHIEKYSVHNIYVIDETPEIYKSVTLPYLTEEQFNLQWVYNILEHKSETDRIVFEDPDEVNGFILLPDLKWDGTTLDTLYLVAITQARDIKSLRDLTDKHLNLLENIKNRGIRAIEEKYGLDGSQLRIYLHYQPSFYHLHVHFTYLRHEAPGITAERSHLLSNVISNLQLLPDYYSRITLPFVVKESDKLFTKFEQKGILKKITSTHN